MQTSAKRAPKVISLKGRRQVGVIASAEKGKTVTALCCGNAVGKFLPPALIFPRKRMNNPRLMDGAPAGCLGMCSQSGWVNTEDILQWLQPFGRLHQAYWGETCTTDCRQPWEPLRHFRSWVCPTASRGHAVSATTHKPPPAASWQNCVRAPEHMLWTGGWRLPEVSPKTQNPNHWHGFALRSSLREGLHNLQCNFRVCQVWYQPIWFEYIWWRQIAPSAVTDMDQPAQQGELQPDVQQEGELPTRCTTGR